MKNILIIKADTNDADYVYSINEVSNEEIQELKLIVKAVEEAKAPHGHNWDTSDYTDMGPKKLYEGKLTVEQMDLFSDYCPYGEYGIHTIEEVRILKVSEEIKLL